MSLRSWLARLRPRAAGSLSVSDPSLFVLHPWLREAGTAITIDTAVQVSAVYGCCRLIVDSLAPAPVEIVEVQDGGKRVSRPDDPTRSLLDWGADVNLVPDALPAQAVEEALFWSALLDGNGYAEIQRDRSNKPYALWPLEPGRVTPKRDERGDFYYEVLQPSGGTERVPPSRIFHLRGPSLYGWAGDSIVYRAAKAIGISQASQIFSAAYFANGTVVSVILGSDKMITAQQAKDAKAQWLELFGGGPAKAHQPAVLGQGLKAQVLNQGAKDSQLIESRRFQVQEIARYFGVPTTLLADNEAWTNLSELYLGFYRNALLPWAERFDAEATRKLFPSRKPWREVQHNLTRIVMGSFKDQVAALHEAVNAGIWTRNEARRQQGMNDVGADGDVLVVESTVKPLEEALRPPAPAPAPQAPAGEMDGPEDMPAAANGPKPARAAVALYQYARRLQARRADLERNAPEKVEENIAREREKLLPGLLAACRRALDGIAPAEDFDARALGVADAVLAGEPADLAAERLFGTETRT
jgi:HK97 family phage portal protein